MLTATTRRGRMLEVALDIPLGIFGGAGVGISVRHNRLTIPRVMNLMFLSVVLAWAILAFLGLYIR